MRYYAFAPASVQDAQYTTLQLPAFSYNVVWGGLSEVLAIYSVANDTPFSFDFPIIAPSTTFVLCVAWTDSAGETYRYKLWDAGTALYYPVYAGQRIGVSAQLEIWSTGAVTAVNSDVFNLYSSDLVLPESSCVLTCLQPSSVRTLEIASEDAPETCAEETMLAIPGRAALRALTTHCANEWKYLSYLVTADDGQGGDFVYNASETHVDDEVDYLKPDDVSEFDSGRWVRQNNAT